MVKLRILFKAENRCKVFKAASSELKGCNTYTSDWEALGRHGGTYRVPVLPSSDKVLLF